MTSILDNIESGYPQARRFRLGKRVKHIQESMESEYEIIEFEVKGVTVNRICKKKELAEKVIQELTGKREGAKLSLLSVNSAESRSELPPSNTDAGFVILGPVILSPFRVCRASVLMFGNGRKFRFDYHKEPFHV